METSESITHLAAALVKYHAKAETVTRDKRNPHFKNDYATLDNILDTTRPILAENGISVIQLPTGENGLTTMLLHESGEYIKETYFMPAKANDPQGNGSRLTYQRRYALGAILGIATEPDDDGNKADEDPKEDMTPKVDLPWLNKDTPQFKNAIEGIQSGKVKSIADLRKYYKINKDIEALLTPYFK